MALRVEAYGVCIKDNQLLITKWTPQGCDVNSWSLPGGQVEHGEDPLDSVLREFAEETGYEVAADRLLGVDSRTIPSAERLNHGPDLHRVGVFYQVRVTGGDLRPEPNGATADPSWVHMAAVSDLVRSRVVDTGLALMRDQPITGHVAPVPVGGLLQH